MSHLSLEAPIQGAVLDDPSALRATLAEHGVFDFVSYESGMFPACVLPPEEADAMGGYGKAWFRDNTLVANALYRSGRTGTALRAANGMLSALHAGSELLDRAADPERFNPNDAGQRLPVRVDGTTLVFDTEHRVQNDSAGYPLWFLSNMMREGAIEPRHENLELMAKVVRYLGAIDFWESKDSGHWEEGFAVHGTSVGTVVAGLRAAQHLFEQTRFDPGIDVQSLAQKGESNLLQLLPNERAQGWQEAPERQYDAAQLFLIEPLNVLSPEMAEHVVRRNTEALQRQRGFARYVGDTYWEPRFPSILGEGDQRIREEDSHRRDRMAEGVEYTRTEAQWTLFDSVVSLYWGGRYLETGSSEHRDLQLKHLSRSLCQLEVADSGMWVLPEARYWDFKDGKNSLVSNPNTQLQWSHANLLSAVDMLEQTS